MELVGVIEVGGTLNRSSYSRGKNQDREEGFRVGSELWG